MRRDLVDVTELFKYLMSGYSLELEKVETQNGIQRRLNDIELEYELKEKTKEFIKVKDLFVELKLGPSYNRADMPWIQIFSKENKSGAKGRYIGISFLREGAIEIWIGFGKTGKKQLEIYEQKKQYKVKYALLQPELKYGFSYDTSYYESIIINKEISIIDFDEKSFQRDLDYITKLYKAYEVRFENAIMPVQEIDNLEIEQEEITYEEINKRMLSLIEEMGNLAKAINNMKK